MKQIDGIINMTSDQQAQREILNQGDEDDDEQQLNELEDSEVSDLPNSLIVTNVDSRVFSICDLKVRTSNWWFFWFYFILWFKIFKLSN